jgi:hypothetical protein
MNEESLWIVLLYLIARVYVARYGVQISLSASVAILSRPKEKPSSRNTVALNRAWVYCPVTLLLLAIRDVNPLHISVAENLYSMGSD